jgi:hypothetical protein
MDRERNQKFECLAKPSEGKKSLKDQQFDLFMPTLNSIEGKGTPNGLCSREWTFFVLGVVGNAGAKVG